MFSHIRNALALTVAALAALALTTSAGFAAQQPTYDAYYDGLRIQATQTVRLPATSTRTTAIRSWRTLQPRYDARLDGLRIVSQSTSNERKLTVVRRPVARASAGGAGTQRSA